MPNKIKIRDKILEYYEQILKKRQQKFTHNEKADKLIKQEPAAFLFILLHIQPINTLFRSSSGCVGS